MSHRSGFVNLIGNPNAGKSTLMNQLVGERLSIITSKAQTTRHRIKGIVNGEDFQIVYSDTPGIVDPAYKMHEGMMQFVEASLTDADVILMVIEVGEKSIRNEKIFAKLQKMDIPILIALNKTDLTSAEEVRKYKDHWQNLLPKAEIIPISALKGKRIQMLLKHLKKHLPESPPYFAKDELTDKPMRFFVSEIIREKIFLNYKKEIPYSCEVEVTEYKEATDIIHIRSEIYVERESQKRILIGHKGSALKKMGTDARKDMQDFLQKKVFLDLHIKVNKDWRNEERQLKRFGYMR